MEKKVTMKELNQQFPDYPSSEEQINVENLVRMILSGFPETVRDSAKEILVQDIFPKQTRGIENHPNPGNFYKVFYERIVEDLTEVKPNERLSALKRIYYESEIYDISRSAFLLAKAFFLTKNPQKLEEAKQKDWIDRETSQLLDHDLEGLRKMGAALNNQLDKWQKEVMANYPDLAVTLQKEFLITDLTLKSVENGDFDVAMGSFFDFLNDLNVPVKLLDIH